MESSSLNPESPLTPPHHSNPTHPPRNSMEDADSSVKRKRPRLDSGERTYQGMGGDMTSPENDELRNEDVQTADQPDLPHGSSSLAPSTPPPLPPATPNNTQSESSEQHFQQPKLNATPSKVTLNLRDPSGSSPSRGAAAVSQPPGNGQEVVPVLQPSGNDQEAEPVLQHALDKDQPAADSLPGLSGSGDLDPVEIQAAQPEFIDNPPEESVWGSLGEMNYLAWNQDIMSRFPIIGGTEGPLSDVFLRYRKSLTVSPQQMSQVLRATDEWLNDYLQESAGWNEHWDELFFVSAQWWSQFCKTFKYFLRPDFMDVLEQGCNTDTIDRTALVDLICTAMELTTRLLRADKTVLHARRQDRNVPTRRAAREYLLVINGIYANKSLVNSFEMLEFNNTPESDLGKLQESIHRGYSILTAISDYWLSALEQNISDVDLLEHMIAMFRTAVELSYIWLDPGVGIYSDQLADSYCNLFLALTNKFSFAVKKQFAMINSEFLTKFVQLASALIPRILYAKESLMGRVTTQSSDDLVQLLETTQRAEFATVAWKLDFLENCIRQGRMETRIAALEYLSSTLIDVYKQYISQAEPPFGPIVEWTSNRLKQSKLIDYLFGVESHPQIVHRSNNVVGFLAASQTYSNHQTDMIWNCARITEDPRMFDAIVSAMSTTFGLLDRPSILYLCGKFHSISAADFNFRCRTFFNQVLTYFYRRYATEERIDLLPFRVLLRLLREIGSDPQLDNERRLEVWNFVADSLKRLQFQNWYLTQRSELYEDCLEDYSSRNGKAVGSCLMLNRLLTAYGRSDFYNFKDKVDVASLVIKEFCSLKSLQLQTGLKLEAFTEPAREMLQIIEKILLWAPDSVPSDLMIPLWSSMVGNDATGKQATSYAWETLAHIASNSITAIPFLDIGISEFLPALDPALYSRSLLGFAHRLSEYKTRITLQSPTQAKASAGMHESLFWQIALDSLDDQMALSASRYLVDKIIQESQISSREDLSEAQSEFIRKAVTRLIDTALERQRLIDDQSLQSDSATRLSSPEIRQLTIKFQRAFLMLKQLSQGLRGLEKQKSPSERSISQVSQYSGRGEKVEIKYQTSDRGVPSVIKSLEISKQATVKEFIDYLRSKTGFSRFNLIAGGKRIDQDESPLKPISDTNIIGVGLILVHKVPGSELINPKPSTKRSGLLEHEIMKFFPQLYDLLSIDRTLGQSVLDFLITFPPNEEIVRQILDPQAMADTILPSQEPFKLIYSLHAMKHALHRQNEEGAIDADFMVRCVRSIVAKFVALNIKTDQPDPLEQLVAVHLVIVLTYFLRERVQADIRERYFDVPEIFVNQVINLCGSAGNEQVYDVSRHCFSILLEAALLNKSIWDRFISHSAVSGLFELLLLTDPKAEGREIAKKSLMSVLATLPRIDEDVSNNKEQYKRDIAMFAFEEVAFLKYVWGTLLSILPSSANYAENSAQFFELSIQIFRRLNEIALDMESLQRNVKEWLNLLLEHKHNEVLGRELVDQFMRGLSELIDQALTVSNAITQKLETDDTVLDSLFSAFLFPQIDESIHRQSAIPMAPILSSDTRKSLYSIVMKLSSGKDDLLKCINTVNKALNDVADPGIQWSYERDKQVRSAAGYPGLVNLSNTCYLNSLMTQLFMNPRFREFILGLEIYDPSRQRLLYALRQLFVDLQDGWSKAILTQELAEAIETYEGPLDPAIQMDADEAFNLIFDRIDGQLSSPADKQNFKAIYGGQIVQQIKSKECEHISERLDSLTAVQCDIQGKVGLEDSLKAYIEGETMEGDNKYKCSTCDRYVNAVKRACFRDVPNNLIFHLKRFDFDLVQGTRNKLNDYFTFPERVDMTPYTDKYLQDPSSSQEPDWFLLTGVLVHSGTAELGHYYSFIRERPLALDTWVEFNDSDVSRYDVRCMQDLCYGGESRDSYTLAPTPKSYSAYMLFYQRESSITRDDEYFLQQQATQTVRAKIPDDLAVDIAVRNERLARTYCLFDPAHQRFLAAINQMRRKLKADGPCSSEHHLETAYIECIWQHLFYVFGREHQRASCDPMLSIITDMMIACIDCCKASIDWMLGEDDQRLRILLLRQPDQKVRVRTGNLLRDGLLKLREQGPLYFGSTGIDMEMDDELDDDTVSKDRFKLTMSRLRNLQKFLPNHPRAWVDFYELLSGFSRFGLAEKIYIHHIGFLQHALEILLVDSEHDWSSFFYRHAAFLKQLEKRQYNLAGLGTFIQHMLPAFRPEPDAAEPDEVLDFTTSLTREELVVIRWQLKPNDSDRPVPWIVERLAVNDDYTMTSHLPLRTLVRWIVQNDNILDLNGTFEDLVNIGLEKNPAWLAEPYLHIALAYSETCTDGLMIERILHNISRSLQTIGNQGGPEHFEFFQAARKIVNAKAFPERHDEIKLILTRLAPQWVVPLLAYPKENVAEQTRLLTETMLFPNSSDDEDEELSDAKQSSFNTIFSVLVKELHKFISSTQALGATHYEIFRFCDNGLEFAYTSDEEQVGNEKRSDVRRLLEGIQSMLVVSDDGSNPNADSDDMSEISSTRMNFYDAKGFTSADPIML